MNKDNIEEYLSSIEDIIEDDLEQERLFRNEISKYIDDKIENEIVARAIKNGTIAKA